MRRSFVGDSGILVCGLHQDATLVRGWCWRGRAAEVGGSGFLAGPGWLDGAVGVISALRCDARSRLIWEILCASALRCDALLLGRGRWEMVWMIGGFWGGGQGWGAVKRCFLGPRVGLGGLFRGEVGLGGGKWPSRAGFCTKMRRSGGRWGAGAGGGPARSRRVSSALRYDARSRLFRGERVCFCTKMRRWWGVVEAVHEVCCTKMRRCAENGFLGVRAGAGGARGPALGGILGESGPSRAWKRDKWAFWGCWDGGVVGRLH